MRNLEFLAWVDEQLALDTQVSVSSHLLEMEAELIRVQLESRRILQYITSPERKILYRVWLTRHALRCGLTRSELRVGFLPLFRIETPTR